MKKIIAVILAFLALNLSVYALEPEYKLEPEYSSGTDFYKGLAIVQKDGKSAVVDRSGNFILNFSEDKKLIRSNGLIMHVGANDKAAFFDKQGNQVTDYIYDVFSYTDEKFGYKQYYLPNLGNDGDGKSDLIPVSRDLKFGFINSEGEEVIPLELEYAYGFYGGFAIICSGSEISKYGTYINCRYGLINEKGEIIAPADSCWDISRYNVNYRTGYKNETLHFLNYIDTADTILSPYGREVINDVSDELGFATLQALGVKHVIKYTDAGEPYVIDANGEIIFPAGMYSAIELFGDNFIVGGTTVINRNNERLYDLNETLETLQLEYGRLVIYSIDDNFAEIRIPANDGIYGHVYSGLVDSGGKVILPPEYEFIADRGEGIIYARTGEKNLLFDYNGKCLGEINGQLVGEFNDGLALFWDFETMKRGYIKNPLTYPKVYVNGEKIQGDADARIYNNRTLVPMRVIFEELGAEIEWDDKTRTVKAIKGEDEILVVVGSNIMYKNGEEIKIDVPARIENNRTLIPLRAVSEALNCRVMWDEEKREVNIFDDMG